jgi:hypothetical protein
MMSKYDPDFSAWDVPGAFACRCPFADLKNEAKCCQVDMLREQAVKNFTETFERAPKEDELPERLRIGGQR